MVNQVPARVRATRVVSDDGGASIDMGFSDPNTNVRSRARVCLSKRVSPGWSIGRANVASSRVLPEGHFDVCEFKFHFGSPR